MKKTFKIHGKLLFLIGKENIIIVIGITIMAPIFNYFRDKPIKWDTQFLFIIAGIIAINNIPALVLLVNYYLENRKTTLVIDLDADIFRLQKNGIEKLNKLSDITHSTYVLSRFYQNQIDNNGRWKMVNSDCGYWDVKFNDGTEYYLSNLLVDFLHDKPFVENTSFKFTMFPFIDKSTSKVVKQKEDRNKLDRFKYLMNLYSEKSEQELKLIINNKNSYQQEAINAAKKVLEEKTLGNNCYNK